MEQEYEHNPKYIESILELPCPSCGNQLSYSAKTGNIRCGHCGFSRTVDQASDMVEERSLRHAAEQMQTYTPQAVEKKVIDCGSCGAQLMLAEDQVATRCNFCGSEKVNETAQQKNMIQPQGIIPFQIPKRVASDKFREWIAKGWFKPNKLQRLADLEDIHGIYVPFWTYDAKTFTRWSGEAGHYYYETEYHTNAEGEQEEEKVKKIRWEHHSGSFDHFFDDVLIVASKGLPHKMITPIYPYELDKVINYSNELMVGWESEIYSLDVMEGYKIAEEQMDAWLHSEVEDRIGGDEQRHIQLNTEKWNQTFKHVLLPVWLCSYIYNDKTYQFAINGQTGKISGQKPTSWVKVVFAILVVIAVIAGIVYLTKR